MEIQERDVSVPDSVTTFTQEDRSRLAKVFSLKDYQVAEDAEGQSYVVVTLPKEIEPWVKALRRGLLDRVQKRLESVDRLENVAKTYDQTIRNSPLTEEQETVIRHDPKILPVLNAAFGELGEAESSTKLLRRLTWKLFFQDPFYENIRAIVSWPFTRFKEERQRELEAKGLSEMVISNTIFEEFVLKKSPSMQICAAMFHDQGEDKLSIDRFIVRDSLGEKIIRSPALNNISQSQAK